MRKTRLTATGVFLVLAMTGCERPEDGPRPMEDPVLTPRHLPGPDLQPPRTTDTVPIHGDTLQVPTFPGTHGPDTLPPPGSRQPGQP
jgi:hypothetical protein